MAAQNDFVFQNNKGNPFLVASTAVSLLYVINGTFPLVVETSSVIFVTSLVVPPISSPFVVFVMQS